MKQAESNLRNRAAVKQAEPNLRNRAAVKQAVPSLRNRGRQAGGGENRVLEADMGLRKEKENQERD